MKKIAVMMAGLMLAGGVEATTIVEITQAAPGASALSSETMSSYDCFIVRNGTLGKAMGKTPETSQAGVNEVVAYLNSDFAANYATLLADAYGMIRDANRKDFRNSGGLPFGERFGLVVYNPTDGKKEGVGDIAYFRVFNLDNKSPINDSKAHSGYWSDWQPGGAVPEPTSGMLAVLGAAALALRRKRP